MNTNKAAAQLSATQRAALESLSRGKARPIRVVFAIALALACGACGVRPVADTTPAASQGFGGDEYLADCYARGARNANDIGHYVSERPSETHCRDAYALGAHAATESLEDAAAPIYSDFELALSAPDGFVPGWCYERGYCD